MEPNPMSSHNSCPKIALRLPAKRLTRAKGCRQIIVLKRDNPFTQIHALNLAQAAAFDDLQKTYRAAVVLDHHCAQIIDGIKLLPEPPPP